MTRLQLTIEGANVSLLMLKVFEIFVVGAGVDVGIFYLARLDVFGLRLHNDISMTDLENCKITDAQMVGIKRWELRGVQGGHDGFVDPCNV